MIIENVYGSDGFWLFKLVCSKLSNPGPFLIESQCIMSSAGMYTLPLAAIYKSTLFSSSTRNDPTTSVRNDPGQED